MQRPKWEDTACSAGRGRDLIGSQHTATTTESPLEDHSAENNIVIIRGQSSQTQMPTRFRVALVLVGVLEHLATQVARGASNEDRRTGQAKNDNALFDPRRTFRNRHVQLVTAHCS